MLNSICPPGASGTKKVVEIGHPISCYYTKCRFRKSNGEEEEGGLVCFGI